MEASGSSALAVSVVLPTYNEAESLPVIVPRIARTLSEAGIAGEIIVVDDNSPDGTAEVASKLAEEFPVRVKKRVDERGLATAVLTGFAMSEAEVCVVMDADGSHPVSALPEMIKIILADKADVVVGSRHVPGGGSKDWPLFSQFKSKLAATLALGVTSMTDPTTGFLATRRSLLHKLDLDPVGWKIVLEIVVKATPVRVAEVPIIFVDRELGVSKQSVGVFAEYLSHLAKLYAFRYPSLAELVRFCLVGVLGMCVDLATVIALKELFALDTRLCAVFGFIVAVTSNFILNRKYTFARARELPLLFSYATYVGTNLAGLALRMLAIQSLIVIAGIDHGRGYVVTNFIGIVLATLINFVGAKYFAFDPERIRFPNEEPTGVPRPSSMPPRLRAWGISLIFVLSAGYAFATTVPRAELQLPDEGVNVTMARNIRRSQELFVRPSVYPGGRADWREEDLPALGNLPFYPALLALMPQLPGFSGMALLSFAALIVTVFCTARLVSLVDKRAGLYTGILLSCSPAFLEAHQRIEFEPILTAFCAAGLFLFVRGAWYRHVLVCFLGGTLLGFGFLTKMWLIVPYAFALIAFCVIEAASARSQGQSVGLRKSVAAGGVGFMLTASAHVVFVALVSPQDLPAWLSSVYLGIFSGQGVTGGKLSAIASYASHERPATYYPLVLYRDHFFLAPLALFGLGELLRSPRPRTSRLLAMIVGAVIALVALSVPAYKEARYVLAVTPFLYALAGLCLAAFARAPDKLRPAATATVRVTMALTVIATVVVALLHVLGVSSAFGRMFLFAHAFGALLCILLGELWMRTRFVTRELAILSALGLTVSALVQARWGEPNPPYQALSQLLSPQLAAAAPAYPSFFASDHNVLQGYLDRAGAGFEELANPAEAPQLTAYVFAPQDGRRQEGQKLLPWLETHTREVTSELAEPDTGYRVFVKDSR
ncbi:MAG TPA: glycosyltransferase [Polyangiales bacterium]|nr:glycosyltransferase [Polyangiales bacterium]